MNLLESILYSLVTAAAEFLPVSTRAHQTILMNLFGGDSEPYLLQMFIHIAALIAVLVNSREMIIKINQTNQLLSLNARRRKRQPDNKVVCTIRLLKTAAFPMLLGFVLCIFTHQWGDQLHILSLMLVINGIILFIPAHIPQGNKDARSISGLESFLIGIFSGLGAIPGLSRLGMGLSAALARGADPQHALNWNILLAIPALIVLIAIDLFMLVTNGIPGFHFLMVLQYLFSAIFAYIGAYFSLMFLRFMAVKMGFSTFAYYCWGAALFAFILYMI